MVKEPGIRSARNAATPGSWQAVLLATRREKSCEDTHPKTDVVVPVIRVVVVAVGNTGVVIVVVPRAAPKTVGPMPIILLRMLEKCFVLTRFPAVFQSL